MITRTYHAITTFGLGYRRPASGTWGSLPPVVLAGVLWLVGMVPGGHEPWGTVVYHVLLGAMLVYFCWVCVVDGGEAELRFGHDPHEVVADETAGQCIPLLGLPAVAFATWWQAGLTLAGAFVLFRLLDIIKPWPAGGFQRIQGGWGILLDDLMAAVYAAVILQVAVRWAW